MKGTGAVVGVVLLMILITKLLRPIQRIYNEHPMYVIIGITIIIVSAYLIVSYRKKIIERKSK